MDHNRDYINWLAKQKRQHPLVDAIIDLIESTDRSGNAFFSRDELKFGIVERYISKGSKHHRSASETAEDALNNCESAILIENLMFERYLIDKNTARR